MMIMAYYFAVETQNNNYNAINIKRSRAYLHNAYMYEKAPSLVWERAR